MRLPAIKLDDYRPEHLAAIDDEYIRALTQGRVLSPGPWSCKADSKRHPHYLISCTRKMYGGKRYRDVIATCYEGAADAQMMTAAPRMYRLLKKTVGILKARGGDPDGEARHLEAIEKLLAEVGKGGMVEDQQSQPEAAD